MSPGVVFHSHTDATITIGERCDIGAGVTFIPGGHAIGSSERRAGAGFAKPIEIGDGTWIGAHSVILGGVRVGAGCIVAAGSVVTRNLPDNTLAAGVPAIVKRQLKP
jgi:acetyltransferase-like isoleucine patch superfamily enzyme